MEKSEWEKVRELFFAAVELSESGRARFLDEKCGPDTPIRREVEELLRQDAQAKSFLSRPAIELLSEQAHSTIPGPTVDRDTSTAPAPHAPAGLTTSPASRAGERPTLIKGETFGDYRLVRRLGRGGFGEVWEAVSLTTGRRLALKALTTIVRASPDTVERFKREAKLAASLNHPRCVFVYGAEEIEGYGVITMELVSGGTLQDRLDQRGPLPIHEAVDLILDVIEGLEAANLAGILHRDVKPSNCFVDENGRCKIGDFGLSKTLEAPDTLTTSGTFLGTPAFASPEQIRGRQVGVQSDIYSVGATLYTLITGKFPFKGRNVVEILARIVSEPPVPFSDHRVNVRRGLQRAIFRAMAKDKEDRFASYGSLRAALLPFSSRGLTAADLVKRFVALEIDFFLCSVLSLAILGLRVRTNLFRFAFVRLLMGYPTSVEFAIVFLYFFLQEAIWRRTIGKKLSELRIETSSIAPMMYRQVFLRTLVFVAIGEGWEFIFQIAPRTFQNFFFSVDVVLQRFEALAPGPFFLTEKFQNLFGALAPGLCLITARASNGYAGIHEILSRTRVMGIQPNERLAVPAFRIPRTVTATSNQTYGPYRISGIIWRTETQTLLEARDELLDRNVWIHEYATRVSRPVSESSTNRPGRLRWLQGSRDEPRHWDAYEAPRGIPFCRWVHQRGRLSWLEMREILLGMVVAMKADSEDLGSIPDLCLSNIWIDPTGQPRLTAFPIELEGDGIRQFQVRKATDWLQFLREVAAFGLTGKSDTPGNGQVDRPAVPLPHYARNLLDKIWWENVSNPLQLVQHFQAVSGRPASVSANRRIGPVLLTALWLFVNLLGTVRFSTMVFHWRPLWLEEIGSVPQYTALLHELEPLKGPDAEKDRESVRKVLAFIYSDAHSLDEGRNILSSFPPEWVTDLEVASTRYPRLSNREILGARISVSRQLSFKGEYSASPKIAVITQAPWLLILDDALINGVAAAQFAIPLAFVLGTSPLLWVFGIGLQTKEGKTAGRFRCGLRAAAAWLPFLIWSASLGSGFGADNFAKRVLNWEASLIVGLVVIVGIAFSIAKPDRGIPDIIAGTHLVPR